ncbi:PREDICTED: unnamed product [Prunus dulcis]|uniref:PREDICTED: unnamed product n=1 Tax=Prunus dulcis TaxID=3755 RepID=A0A5E4F742_PRUDU|nr:PREDICTED: unnamed product [Prunus dulcis]
MATPPTSSAPSSKSSKGWISNISSIAARVYFFLIILQIPLFRVPCRSGICTTPLHVTSSQLIASEIFPIPVVKALLFPGAVANGLVLAGSYFAVAGALVGLLKRGRMSMFGTLLMLWGLIKEGILGKPVNTDPTKAVFVYPTMLIAVIAAFSSVKYDVKKVVRSAPARPIAKPLLRSSKSKLK